MRELVVVAALIGCGSTSPSPPPPRELRLLTYNLNFGNPNFAATLDAISAADADIVVLQEVTPEWERALHTRLDKDYGYSTFHIPDGGAAGHAALSRFPFTTDELLSQPPGGFYRGHRLVVATPTGALQLLHVHLRASIDDSCFRGRCSDLDWVKGQFTTPPIRLREIREHWQRVDRTLPTVVVGDFNEQDDGDAVQFLTHQGLTRIPTRGPSTWHLVRKLDGHDREVLTADIDHVLVDRRVEGVDATVFDAGTSDHRPVVARLRIR